MDVNPARQGESPILELVSVSQKGLREGTTRGGLVRGAHPVVDGSSLPGFGTRMQGKCGEKQQARHSGKKKEIY